MIGKSITPLLPHAGAEHDSSKLEQPENGRLVTANGAAAVEPAAEAGPLSGAGLLTEKGEGAGRGDSTLATASGLPGISIPKSKSGKQQARQQQQLNLPGSSAKVVTGLPRMTSLYTLDFGFETPVQSNSNEALACKNYRLDK